MLKTPTQRQSKKSAVNSAPRQFIASCSLSTNVTEHNPASFLAEKYWSMKSTGMIYEVNASLQDDQQGGAMRFRKPCSYFT
jgi:hypothetical protein